MKAPRIFTPHNPLADRLHDRRGVDALTATSRAQVAIRCVEPIALVEVDRALAILGQDLAAYRAAGPEAVVFETTRLYAAADALAGLAPAFQRPRLGEAAASLCRLLAEDGVSRPDAIVVHIEALSLIRQGDSIGEFILPGLQKISTFAPSEPALAIESATRPQALGHFTDRSEATP